MANDYVIKEGEKNKTHYGSGDAGMRATASAATATRNEDTADNRGRLDGEQRCSSERQRCTFN